MQIPLFSTLLVIATLSSASALTGDDIAPASLPGKTFVFTITTSEGSPARSGVWKGTFAEAPSTSFEFTNVSGNTVERTLSYTTQSLSGSVPTTSIQLPTTINPSQDFIVLSLIITDGTGTFSMSTISPGVNAQISTQTGTFVLEGAPSVPEISVKQGTTTLTDGSAAKISIGTAKLGKKITKKFTITNSGNGNLTGLSVTVDGKNKADFTIGTLAKKTLSGGTSTSFNVTFKPTLKGTKNAAIHIKSNDANENPFDIKLTGIAVK